MAKTKISEFDSTPANNTDIDSINIAEGCAPSGINNAIRELMSQLKDQQTGASGDNFTVGGNLAVTGSSTFTGAVVLSTALPVASGGTGASTAGNARTNLSAASSGANSDITSLTGLTTGLSVAQGGTGQTSYTNGQLLIGNTTGNTLSKSTLTAGSNITITNGNGTITIAAAGFGSGSVTSVATGNGLTGGTITTTGTISLDFYTGTSEFNTSFPVGSYLLLGNLFLGVPLLNNNAPAIYVNSGYYDYAPSNAGFGLVAGTWRSRGSFNGSGVYCYLVQRVA